MKTSLFYILLGVSSLMVAQNMTPPEFSFHPVSMPKTECVSEAQRSMMLQEIEENKQIILQRNPEAFQQRTTSHPLFILPIRPKAGFDDYGYYSLFNQVDQDLTPNGNILDYNCGQRTYDWAGGNHAGTDYVVWPYPWKKMEDDVMEIIAAAPGIIVDKRDGNFDKNCVNEGNPLWNGIVIEHADGSRAIYMHFKDGGITTKAIGDTVVAGEFLGLAGSSGSSTLPHLHFEVHDAAGEVVDPYVGPCNEMNSETWWQEQPEYFIPEILTRSTHNSDDFDTECPEVENPYEELNFVPGEDVRFRIFYRDIQTNDRTEITVERPDGSILYDYFWDSTWPDYVVAWGQWVFPIDNSSMDGVYTVTATFGGKTYETIFGVNTNLGVENQDASAFVVYPNPTSGMLHIKGELEIDTLVVYDLLGRRVLGATPVAKKAQIDMGELNSGVYFVSVTSEGNRTVRKIVKE